MNKGSNQKIATVNLPLTSRQAWYKPQRESKKRAATRIELKKLFKETAVTAGMAGSTGLYNLYKQCVIIAVRINTDYLLRMTRG